MIKTTPRFEAADLFCGAGGMTIGAEQSGHVKVRVAVNHWRTAIFTHQDNHPDTRHICARVEDMNIRCEHDLPDINFLCGGIECTHHSTARGGRPINDQKRTSAWRVMDWIERFEPEWCVFENVAEFRKWGPVDEEGRKIKAKAGSVFEAWINTLKAYGYHVEHDVLNAADFGAATNRKRLFIIARRGHSDAPISWPKPTHADNHTPAWKIIDWSNLGESIFNRKKPLAEKTIKRITYGLRKFVGEAAEPFIVRYQGTSTATTVNEPTDTVTAQGKKHGLCVPFQMQASGPGWNDPVEKYSGTFDIQEPTRTIIGSRNHTAVVQPFIATYHNGPDGDKRSGDVDEPLPTQDTSNRHAVVSPFILDIHHGSASEASKTRDVDQPIPTVVTKDGHCLVSPLLIDVNHGDGGQKRDRTHSVEEPIGSQTSKRGKALIAPFLVKYYGTGQAVPVTQPLDTVTTKDRFGLAMAELIQTMNELNVVDIRFRMLTNEELARAQGFPENYTLHGNKGDQTRQIGNAVCPPVMKAICEAIAEDN